jgi:hypothetical protein
LEQQAGAEFFLIRPPQIAEMLQKLSTQAPAVSRAPVGVRGVPNLVSRRTSVRVAASATREEQVSAAGDARAPAPLPIRSAGSLVRGRTDASRKGCRQRRVSDLA